MLVYINKVQMGANPHNHTHTRYQRIRKYVLYAGDFQFAVSSDDNSELWLSSDDSPLNARLMAYVGKVSDLILSLH